MWRPSSTPVARAARPGLAAAELCLALVLCVEGCPAEVPTPDQLSFGCREDDECAPGYACVAELCQREGTVIPADARVEAGDAAALDVGAPDAYAADAWIGRDQGAGDGAGSDQAPADRQGADRSAADGAGGDLLELDAQRWDRLTTDAPAEDIALADATAEDAPAADRHGDAAEDGAVEDATPCADGDGDTVCDAQDVCPGADDRRDADADGVPDGCDCGWLDPQVYPGAGEVCANFKDDDCSGSVDDGPCAVGCADGAREGFADLASYLDVAGCAGGWSEPGVLAAAAPACSRGGGDDGVNPAGVGCNVADLCAVGWHVCRSSAEVAAASPTGCAGATAGGDPPFFFATRQSGPGYNRCGSGANDVFGCGNQGLTSVIDCGVLDRSTADLCGRLERPPWDCGSDDEGEANHLAKSAASSGGVLCCSDRVGCGGADDDGDGLGADCDPCPQDPDNDIDGDGLCADADLCPLHYNPAQNSAPCRGKTCLDILQAGKSLGSGVYQIDPDGAAGQPPFAARCEMGYDGGGWTLVGRELPQHADHLRLLGSEQGTPLQLALGGDGLIGVRLAGAYDEIVLTWGDLWARFTPALELFESRVDTEIALSGFTTNDPTLSSWVSFAGGARFCRAAAAPDALPGDSSWAIKPSDDDNTGCGCNSGDWTGRGAYYSGSPAGCTVCTCWGPGGFVGVKDSGEAKSGEAPWETQLWVR